MTNNATYVSRTEVTLAREEKTASEIEAEVRMGRGLRMDGTQASYETEYSTETQVQQSKSSKIKRNVKISRTSGDLFEIVLDHTEAGSKWSRKVFLNFSRVSDYDFTLSNTR